MAENNFVQRPKNLWDYERLAEIAMTPQAWKNCSFPTQTGQTFNDSKETFKRYRFRPRIMTDVSTRRLSTTLLGQPVALPIGVAPTACHRYAHRLGEIGTAQGAAAAGVVMIESMLCQQHVTDIVAAAPEGVRWKQVYIWKDRRVTEHVIRKVEEHGYQAIVVTVDSPTTGIDIEYYKKNITFFNQPEFKYPLMDLGTKAQEEAKTNGDPNFFIHFYQQYDPSLTWKDITWLKQFTSLPVVCKGILTGEAAQKAADAGADAIIVSAHGGRQLDGTLAPGATGVEHVFKILREELDGAMQLCGCPDVNAIPRDVVVHQSFC